MKPIYRIEHKNMGVGPYHAGNGHFLDLQKYKNDDWLSEHCPIPHFNFSRNRQFKFMNMDSLQILEGMFFGFQSIKALKTWFTPLALARLSNNGFVCRVYLCKKYQKTENQIVFEMAKATKCDYEFSLKEI